MLSKSGWSTGRARLVAPRDKRGACSNHASSYFLLYRRCGRAYRTPHLFRTLVVAAPHSTCRRALATHCRCRRFRWAGMTSYLRSMAAADAPCPRKVVQRPTNAIALQSLLQLLPFCRKILPAFASEMARPFARAGRFLPLHSHLR